MRWFKVILQLFFILLVFSSCGEPTMEEDAQKAADFSNQSNGYAMDNDPSNAGRTYGEAQAIMNKYKRLGKFDEFYMLYSGFLEAGAYELFESELKEDSDMIGSESVK